MKKNRDKEKFLEELKQIPIIQAAAERSSLSRNTIYRWRKEDDKFRVEMDRAMQEGTDLINDLSEVQLLSLIKNQDWRAISFWLRLRNPKFKTKVEIEGNLRFTKEATPEEKELIEEAMRLSLPSNSLSETNEEKNE